jgi:uncharacterized protein (TIGR03066 family)
MDSLFRLLLVLAVGLVAVGDVGADEPNKARELLGVWKRTTQIKDKEVLIEIDFQDAGAFRLRMLETVIAGTWTVDDEVLEITLKVGNKLKKKRVPFTITDNGMREELKLTDPRGEIETFHRIKIP